MFPTKFQASWPLGSGEEAKIDFQDGHHGGHLGFPIGMILAVFDLQVTLLLPTRFQVKWTFGSGEEGKKLVFQDGYSGFPIGTILAIFDIQVTPMLPNTFQVDWLFGLGEEAKNTFSKWLQLRQS